MSGEFGHLVRDWWCRGGGGAVLILVLVVSVFRRPADPIFWAAVVFFVGHTAMAVRTWFRCRRIRVDATVTRHHDRDTHPPVVPPKPPVTERFRSALKIGT